MYSLSMNGGCTMSESQLVYEVMRTIGRHGSVYRCNAGQFYTKSGQRVNGLPKGFADVMAILPGPIFCFIECKVGTNKPSDEQIKFIDKMNSLGCRAGVAYSVDDACRICGIVE
jgi:hypothetical protein